MVGVPSQSQAPTDPSRPENKKDLSMDLVSSARHRVRRAAVLLLLVALTVLGVAAVASANSPTVLPVEPDGGIGD